MHPDIFSERINVIRRHIAERRRVAAEHRAGVEKKKAEAAEHPEWIDFSTFGKRNEEALRGADQCDDIAHGMETAIKIMLGN